MKLNATEVTLFSEGSNNNIEMKNENPGSVRVLFVSW